MKPSIHVAILLSFILVFFLCYSCSKKSEEALPPVTQNGSNTFACMINGRPYVACTEINLLNFGGQTSRLRVVSGEPNTTVLIMYTYDQCSENDEQDESINLSFAISNDLTAIYQGVNYRCRPPQEYLCPELNSHDFRYFDTLSLANFIRIQKYDVSERVASGEFEFDLVAPGCNDTLHIRQGRFDVKF